MPYKPTVNCEAHYDHCTGTSNYYLVVGCDQKHIKITTPCTICLDVIVTFYKDGILKCAECYQTIRSGQYQLYNPGTQPLIKTWNLHGERIRATPNPDHHNPKILEELEYLTEGINYTTSQIKGMTEDIITIQKLTSIPGDNFKDTNDNLE